LGRRTIKFGRCYSLKLWENLKGFLEQGWGRGSVRAIDRYETRAFEKRQAFPLFSNQD